MLTTTYSLQYPTHFKFTYNWSRNQGFESLDLLSSTPESLVHEDMNEPIDHMRTTHKFRREKQYKVHSQDP